MAPQEGIERSDVELAGASELKPESVAKQEMASTPEVSTDGSAGEMDYDKLWYIHGQAYDLQANGWLDRHPGESQEGHVRLLG